jgi:hypothetical protein
VTSFFEQFTKYMQCMAVLEMSREQLEADPVAMETLLDIVRMIDADPLNPIAEGLRPKIEKILSPQPWSTK